ncbi:hypothetical protein [Phormidium tenue]
MAQSKIDESFQEIRSLIDFLKSRTEAPTEKILSLYFERHELGSLHLDYEEASRYHKCLRNLIKNSVKDNDLSLKKVENAFQETLLKALCVNTSSISEDLRISEILQNLKQKITAKRITYRCYIPICGISERGLPLSIGQIEFIVFDDLLVNHFQEIVAKHPIQKEDKWKTLKNNIDTSFYEKVFSVVTVEAKDYESAQVIAIKKTRKILDILNFFSALVPYNPDAWAYLSGDSGSHLFETIILNEDDGVSLNIGRKRLGSLQKLEILRIIESDEKDNIGFSHINNLLKKNNLNKFEQALITAIQWIGRAVIANRREDAFLFYAIALESIVLVDNEKAELSYRLRIRIAHLITSNPKNRKEVVNAVRELYNLRSKLVHDGKYEITDLELNSMKFISIRCIQRLCIDPRFQNITSPEDFSDWLEDQILANVIEKSDITV